MSELDKDRETILAATEGPWEHRGGAWRVFGPGPCTCGECDDKETIGRVLCRKIEDAAFIARARTRWPMALNELTLLKAIRHEAENVLVAYATAEGEGLDACEDLAVALEDYNKGMAND